MYLKLTTLWGSQNGSGATSIGRCISQLYIVYGLGGELGILIPLRCIPRTLTDLCVEIFMITQLEPASHINDRLEIRHVGPREGTISDAAL